MLGAVQQAMTILICHYLGSLLIPLYSEGLQILQLLGAQPIYLSLESGEHDLWGHRLRQGQWDVAADHHCCGGLLWLHLGNCMQPIFFDNKLTTVHQSGPGRAMVAMPSASLYPYSKLYPSKPQQKFPGKMVMLAISSSKVGTSKRVMLEMPTIQTVVQLVPNIYSATFALIIKPWPSTYFFVSSIMTILISIS